MARAWIAIALAPTIVALALFGLLALVAIPIMLFVTATTAAPLFLALKRREWLSWWHATISGALCAVCFIALDMLLSDFAWPELLTSNNVLYVGLGALIGTLFWWLGVFRNPAFPFVSRRFPLSFAFVIPIAIGGALLHKSLRPTYHQGRVISVTHEKNRASNCGLASVRLSGGASIEAEFCESWMDQRIVGKCFHLWEGWSSARLRRTHRLISQFGGDVNDC